MASGCKSGCGYVGVSASYSPGSRIDDRVAGSDYLRMQQAAKNAKGSATAKELYRKSGSMPAAYASNVHLPDLLERMGSITAPKKGMATSSVYDIGAVVYSNN